MEHPKLNEIMEQHYQTLLLKAVSLLHNFQDAEDALQNAYLKAWLHIDSFRGKSSCNAWLSRIVYNECISLLRTRKRQPLLFSDEHLECMLYQQNEYECDLDETDLNAWLTALSDKQRRTFYMRYILGYDIANTARLLSLAEGTVKSQMHHARQVLKRQFTHIA